MPNPPFGMPKISFESPQNSSEATRGLRRFCLWGNTPLTGKVTGTRSLTLEHLYFHPLHQAVSLLQRYASRMGLTLLAPIAIEMNRKPLPDCHHLPSSVDRSN